MNFYKLLLHPKDYLRASKFIIAGWYFDFFQKKFKTGGCSFEVPKSLTTRMGRGYFALDLYEKVERRLVDSYIKGNEKVLELGACIGIVSCLVNSRLFQPQNHVVVEANPTLIPFLENNKRLNNSRFKIFNGVISENKEELFYFGNSIVAGTLLNNDNHAKKIAVVGKPLANLEEEYHIQFDTLIMDIEGAEHSFFIENNARLKQFKMIIIENHPHLLDHFKISEYEDILLKNGFHLQEKADSSSVWVK